MRALAGMLRVRWRLWRGGWRWALTRTPSWSWVARVGTPDAVFIGVGRTRTEALRQAAAEVDNEVAWPG